MDYRRGKKLNRSRKTDFAVGIIAGFKTTLQKASMTRIRSSSRSQLPVSMEDRALTDYVAQRYPHVHTFSRSGLGHDAQILADGTERGKKLIIAKGISRSDGFKEKLLEYRDEL